MLGIIGRVSIALVLVGVVLTLLTQWFIRSGSSSALPPITRTEQRIEESKTEGDGPAERVGAAVDEALHKVGELTEKAGQKLQDATDEHKDRAQIPTVTPQAAPRSTMSK